MRDYNFYKLELQWPLIGTMRPELRLLDLHFFNICRHHPTLKFKPHATDDERYVSGIDGVPLKESCVIPGLYTNVYTLTYHGIKAWAETNSCRTMSAAQV